ncbi:SulP family inorganic anion transporter [Paractinoplanes maris]|uniref:SulP family inorganic anion transporter n=1 Tax=Paractinoplanes maris TaxID=1734446 RepID=UPI00202005A0|nr:SulP family inorganic anion transporter [Actinoplanes maris]
MRLPRPGWLSGYRRGDLRADLLAGAAAGAVVIPQAMAYGTVAGLPVQLGLYTCIVPMIIYAMTGGARRMSVSTTSTIVALTGVALTAAGSGDDPAVRAGDAAMLTLLTGAALLLARALRLGFLVESVNEAVLAGLKLGVGLTILVAQLPALLGVPDTGDGFFADVRGALTQLGDVDPVTALIGAGTLVVLGVLARWAPRVPGPLVTLAGGILVVALFHLGDHGVALVPQVPRGLPALEVPAVDRAGALAPYAVAIALLAFLESVSVARLTREPLDPPLDNDRELTALGLASAGGAFFQSVPPAGGFSQTMVNARAGARTQLAGLTTAGLAVVTAIALTPVFAYVPKASLAALVVLAVAGLLGTAEIRRLYRIDRVEALVAAITAVVALVVGLLTAVLAGVLLTYYLVLRALNRPAVVELRRPPEGGHPAPARPGDPPIPGLLILRIEGGLYTGNVRAVQDQLLAAVEAAAPPPRVLLIDALATVDTSVTVMDAFAETDQRLRRRGVELWIASLPTRALAKVRRTAAWSSWASSGRLHPTVDAAVAVFESSATKGERHG